MNPKPERRESVTIVEVGPRDGLQNERVRLNVEQKLEFIDKLIDAGVREIEAGSFVHPKWIPQMANTAELFSRLKRRDGVRYWALVPNPRGLEDAVKVGVREIAVFVSSSETHNQKNLNRTIAESLENIRSVVTPALADGLLVRGYVSTVFGCPYEGDVDFARVLDTAGALLDMGCVQVSLGDTTGMGTPMQVRDGCIRALERFGKERVALHLHDTRGVALASALLAYEAGMRTFDSSVGGMGGCPYAPGAAGNVGTEDLVYMLESSGVPTGINIEKLLAVSRLLDVGYGATLNSPYYRWSRAGRSPRVSA
jgi:hydroxymethylglutaryl-CoA lyase